MLHIALTSNLTCLEYIIVCIYHMYEVLRLWFGDDMKRTLWDSNDNILYSSLSILPNQTCIIIDWPLTVCFHDPRGSGKQSTEYSLSWCGYVWYLRWSTRGLFRRQPQLGVPHSIIGIRLFDRKNISLSYLHRKRQIRSFEDRGGLTLTHQQ